jgi:hypothetical protein
MIVNGAKTNWSKATITSRPGILDCCKCGKKFLKKEVFSVSETKINWFRGDDEVSGFCFNCTPISIRKILKIK